MIESLLLKLFALATGLISALGYWGILLGMAIESACIPLPSEAIMPFAGYLVWKGEMDLLMVSLAGAIGNLIGSIIAYWAGFFGGRPFLLRYGRYFFIRPHDLDLADRWFSRYGEATAFFSRLLPVVRTFISLPAGIARMHFGRFCLYTFLGALPFCYALAWLGYKLGENWQSLRAYFHRMDIVIGALLVIGVACFLRHHFSGQSNGAEIDAPETRPRPDPSEDGPKNP